MSLFIGSVWKLYKGCVWKLYKGCVTCTMYDDGASSPVLPYVIRAELTHKERPLCCTDLCINEGISSEWLVSVCILGVCVCVCMLGVCVCMLGVCVHVCVCMCVCACWMCVCACCVCMCTCVCA